MNISLDLYDGTKTIVDDRKIKFIVPYPDMCEVIMLSGVKIVCRNRLLVSSAGYPSIDKLQGGFKRESWGVN